MEKISEKEYIINGNLYTNDTVAEKWYKDGVTIRVKGSIYILGKNSECPEYLDNGEWLDLYNFENLSFKLHDVVYEGGIYFLNLRDEKLSTNIYNFYINIKNKIKNLWLKVEKTQKERRKHNITA